MTRQRFEVTPDWNFRNRTNRISGQSCVVERQSSSGEATRDDYSPRPTLALQLQHLVDSTKRLRSRLFDETACVDDDEIRAIRIAYQVVTVNFEQAQHPLAVHRVLGAAEADKGVGAFRSGVGVGAFVFR